MASSSPFKMEWKKKNGGSGRSFSKRKREDGPKKHKSAEFVRQSNIGVVTKLNFRDVWSIVRDPHTHVVVRSLGERVDTFSSQQTVYVESAVEEDVIGGLQAQISSQGSKIARLEALIMEIEEWVMKSKTLEERLDVSDLFAHQGMYNALRAFAYLILDAVFKACGMEGLGGRERAEFLSNRGPDGGEAFVSQKAVTVSLFGVEKRIGKREYRIIQSLRKASSGVSAAVSHSASPLEVATALEIEGASVFAGDLKEVWAFSNIL